MEGLSMKSLPRIVLLMMAWSALAGCMSPAPTPEQAAADARPVVALVMKSLANEFFQTMEDGARAHQSENAPRYELLANGIKDEQDVAAQIALVEQMVARKVAALVIAPADSKALAPACKKAMDAGIVVVNIDNRLDAGVLQELGVRIPFVGPDNRKGAKMAGDFVAAKLASGDPVAILEGIPAAYNGIQRKLGLDDAVNAAGLKVVASQSAYWEMDKANALVATLLTEYPGLKAVLCANDSMALGAASAIRSAGKAGQVLVSGFDGIGAVRELIKQGDVLCSVDQHAAQQAAYGIEYALEMLEGKAAPEDQETPLDLVTADAAN
ncbi:MAG: D-ribose-binding periplasmic protein precursor [Candidatus Hydrogenedentota bacterium]|jgi:ribose transport system substrate-binding protein